MDGQDKSIVTVRIPSLLAEFSGGKRRYQTRGTTVRQVLENLFESAPALRVHILDEKERVRQHVLCYVGEMDIRWGDGLDTEIPPDTDVSIIQAVSGG